MVSVWRAARGARRGAGVCYLSSRPTLSRRPTVSCPPIEARPPWWRSEPEWRSLARLAAVSTPPEARRCSALGVRPVACFSADALLADAPLHPCRIPAPDLCVPEIHTPRGGLQPSSSPPRACARAGPGDGCSWGSVTPPGTSPGSSRIGGRELAGGQGPGCRGPLSSGAPLCFLPLPSRSHSTKPHLEGRFRNAGTDPPRHRTRAPAPRQTITRVSCSDCRSGVNGKCLPARCACLPYSISQVRSQKCRTS